MLYRRKSIKLLQNTETIAHVISVELVYLILLKYFSICVSFGWYLQIIQIIAEGFWYRGNHLLIPKTHMRVYCILMLKWELRLNSRLLLSCLTPNKKRVRCLTACCLAVVCASRPICDGVLSWSASTASCTEACSYVTSRRLGDKQKRVNSFLPSYPGS